MPLILESKFELRFATAEGRGRDQRSAGLHCTDVIADLDKRMHPGKYGRFGGRDEAAMTAYAEGGWIWEKILTREFRERSLELNRPGASIFPQLPLSLDGIEMTPDAVLGREHELILAEFKATWRSAKKADDLESYFWPWLIQMGCYAHALGLTKGELYAFFVNGFYEGGRPSVPCVRMWKLEWTKEELEKVWRMVLTHARESMPRKEV